MSIITKLEDTVGWINNKGNVLCRGCFESEFEDEYPSDYHPILLKDEQEDFLYECDCCKERFTA